jgi:Carboxypeptidase regulatory-like domain
MECAPVNLLACIAIAVLSATGDSSISGRVLDAQQRPLPSAQVFLEQGITGTIAHTQTNAEGEYLFEGLKPGLTGVFAVADGTAFDGFSVPLAPEDRHVAPTIVLGRAGSIIGTVAAGKGKAVANANITRMLLVKSRVSIPFSKLSAYGFSAPRSNTQGKFTVSRVPLDTPIALKIAHPSYAQEAVGGLKASQKSVTISLQSGILITGKVFARGSESPVPNATIRFENINPPKDTALTRSGADGSYGVRLKPGDYLYEAIGRSYRSPVKLRLPVTGEHPAMDVSLYVAGTGRLSGQVMDAVTGEPVPNARVLLKFGGTPSAMGRTGASGNYTLDGIAGENMVQFISAPGYLPPANPSMSFQLTPRQDTEVPTFWLMPIPVYTLEVIDDAQQPVADAIVSVLRPRQWGWRTTDNNGLAEMSFASLPVDGRIIGIVEHPQQPLGALFSIPKDRAKDAIVQMGRMTSVRGIVETEAGASLEGVSVQVYLADDTLDEPVLLRQTLSRSDGTFMLEGIPLDIPLIYGTDGAFPPLVHTATAPYSAVPPPLLATSDQAGDSMAGKSINWRGMAHTSGPPLPSTGAPIIAVFIAESGAAAALESLAEMKRHLNRPDWAAVLVVDGIFAAENDDVSIFQGERPGSAMTYVLGKTGSVIFETNLMPPMSLVQKRGL